MLTAAITGKTRRRNHVVPRRNVVLAAALLCFPFIRVVNAQLVDEKFTRLVLSENFDTINPLWTTLANAENLFIVQEGEYIISRKTNISPFAIVADYDNDLAAYRMVTSLNLERANADDGSIGVIFMAQPGGTGGFLAEINDKGAYRVRQIVRKSYVNLTGTTRSGGWVASRAIRPAESFNLIDVRTAKGNYDLYLNNELAFSFSEPAYTSGHFGLVIGPATKGRVDFMYVFSGNAGDASLAATDPSGLNGDSGPTVIELAESIISLKTQINKLNEENQDLRKTIEAMKSDDEDVEARQKSYEKSIKKLQAQIDQSALSFDSLVAANKALLKYKDLVAGNENSDLIITLSKSLKAEKEKNEMLEKENSRLADMLKNQGDGKTGERPENRSTTNKTNSFSLPKEVNQ